MLGGMGSITLHTVQLKTIKACLLLGALRLEDPFLLFCSDNNSCTMNSSRIIFMQVLCIAGTCDGLPYWARLFKTNDVVS